MSATAPCSSATAAQLVKLANGEYTAASVAADPKDATKLNLIKEADGNYGTKPPAPVEAKTSASALSTLTTLQLGGA